MTCKPVSALDAPRRIVDEICHCGHLKTEHEHGPGLNHDGPLRAAGCIQYSWKSHVYGEICSQDLFRCILVGNPTLN
jgi:hypothetical protein